MDNVSLLHSIIRLPDGDMDLDDELASHEPKTNGVNNTGNHINLASMWPTENCLYFNSSSSI